MSDELERQSGDRVVHSYVMPDKGKSSNALGFNGYRGVSCVVCTGQDSVPKGHYRVMSVDGYAFVVHASQLQTDYDE